MSKLDDLEGRIGAFEERIDGFESRLNDITKYQVDNTRDLGLLINETKGLVQLHKDLQGAVRLGITVQKVILWIFKWPVGGGVLIAAYEFLQKHLN